MLVQYSALAKEQIANIHKYGMKEWGKLLADRYIQDMVARAEEVAKNPYIWRPVPYSELQGAYFTTYKKHFIFFRKLQNNKIGVMAIFHRAENIPHKLTRLLQ